MLLVERDDRLGDTGEHFGEASLGLQALERMPLLQLPLPAFPQTPILLAELLRLQVELDEDGYLRAQDFRMQRLEHVIDRADFVTLEDVLVLLADRGEKNDGDVAGFLALLDQLDGLEAVHAR